MRRSQKHSVTPSLNSQLQVGAAFCPTLLCLCLAQNMRSARRQTGGCSAASESHMVPEPNASLLGTVRNNTAKQVTNVITGSGRFSGVTRAAAYTGIGRTNMHITNGIPLLSSIPRPHPFIKFHDSKLVTPSLKQIVQRNR